MRKKIFPKIFFQCKIDLFSFKITKTTNLIVYAKRIEIGEILTVNLSVTNINIMHIHYESHPL